MKDIKRWLPGALVSIALIAAILYFVDFGAMLDAIRNADYRLLGAALVISFAWMGVRGKVWQTLLRDKASYRDVLFTVGEGYLLNNFLPFRLGEIGRAFLLSRKSALQFGEILPTIVIERAVDLAISAAIFLISLALVVDIPGAEQAGIIVGVAMLIGLLMMYVLARNTRWALDTFHKLSVRWPSLQKFGGSFLESFLAGLGVLTDGWLFARFMFWMLLNWGIAIVWYYLVTLAYFPRAEWAWGLVALGAAAFGGAIPSAPGAVGTFETGIVFALGLLTGDESTALAMALTARLYNYLNSGVVGGLGLASEGQTLSGIYQQLRNFRAGVAQAKDSQP
ncbi:MAG: lysylphosphatidylglycerol synthase transmembrane domain-containing protein [Chloroflexota bacterium]